MANNILQIDRALGNVGASAATTLSGALTLTFDTYNDNFLKFDPGGAHRDVTLWPIADSKGLTAMIANAADAAENLVVKNVAGDTIATVNQNEAGIFRCNGSAWSLFCVITIALS